VVGTVGRALIAYNGLIPIPKLDPFNGDHSYFCRSVHLKNRIIHPWYHFLALKDVCVMAFFGLHDLSGRVF
jgi:hypothetical protein